MFKLKELFLLLVIIKCVISYPAIDTVSLSKDIVEPSYFNLYAQPLNSDDQDLTLYPETIEPEYVNIYAQPVIRKSNLDITNYDYSDNSISNKRKTREISQQHSMYRPNSFNNDVISPSYYDLYAQPIKRTYNYEPVNQRYPQQPNYNTFMYPTPNYNQQYYQTIPNNYQTVPNNYQPSYNYVTRANPNSNNYYY